MRDRWTGLALLTGGLAGLAFLLPLWAPEPTRAGALLLYAGAVTEAVQGFRRRTVASQRQAWFGAGLTLLLGILLGNIGWLAGAAITIIVAMAWTTGLMYFLPLVPPLSVVQPPGPWYDSFANAGVFVLLAMGLNIVVGLAGLLDLGYVAFYAIGAYTAAFLASPHFGGVSIVLFSDLPAGFPGIHLPFAVILVLAAALAARTTRTILYYGARTAGELYCTELFDALGVHIVLATGVWILVLMATFEAGKLEAKRVPEQAETAVPPRVELR